MFENYTNQPCGCELCISLAKIHLNSDELYIHLNANTTSKIYRLTKNHQVPLVTTQQYQNHLMLWLKLEQKRYFEHDYALLNRNQTLKSKSNIHQVRPFLDPNGLIRIRGRIIDRNRITDQHYQLLLHPESILTKKIIYNGHLDKICMGIKTTLYHLQKTFYLNKAWTTIEKVLLNCILCKIRTSEQKQIIAPIPDLLQFRNPNHQRRCFTVCFMDIAGPFNILDNGNVHQNFNPDASAFQPNESKEQD